MENLKDLSTSEIELILKNYENEKYEVIKLCVFILRNRGVGILKLDKIIKHFGLSNIEEIFRINDNEKQYYEKEKIILKESNIIDIDSLNIEVSQKELILSLKNIFINYKRGFGYLLVANFILSLTLIITFLLINSDSIAIEDIQSFTKISTVISLFCYIFSIIGIFNLYNSSELRKISEK